MIALSGLKGVRAMLDTWHLTRKRSNIHSFKEYICKCQLPIDLVILPVCSAEMCLIRNNKYIIAKNKGGLSDPRKILVT